MFGFLNVYKPKGMTSHDVVAFLRRVTKIKQIGHTGTLDPFAEGVLPICIGKATRLIEYLSDEKAYIATVQFGKSTDTYDLEGEFVSESNLKVSEDNLLIGLKSFEGEIEQTPPIYSALKVNGKKLYEYARAGVDVEIKSRKVFIEKIELLSFDEVSQVAEIYVKCSKGTYIRSIAHDLGQNLTCGAYLTKLIRSQAGDFLLNESINLNDINEKSIVENNLIYPLEKLPLQRFDINDIELDRASHGMPIYINGRNSTGTVMLVYKDKLVGIAIKEDEKIKIKKFVYEN